VIEEEFDAPSPPLHESVERPGVCNPLSVGFRKGPECSRLPTSCLFEGWNSRSVQCPASRPFCVLHRECCRLRFAEILGLRGRSIVVGAICTSKTGSPTETSSFQFSMRRGRSARYCCGVPMFDSPWIPYGPLIANGTACNHGVVEHRRSVSQRAHWQLRAWFIEVSNRAKDMEPVLRTIRRPVHISSPGQRDRFAD